jgi:hypothetical protein
MNREQRAFVYSGDGTYSVKRIPFHSADVAMDFLSLEVFAFNGARSHHSLE